MKLKRVTALGAVVLGLLAVPTTALASPASSTPGPVTVVASCPPFRPLPLAAPVPAVTVVPGKTASVNATPIAGCCGPVVYARPKQSEPPVYRVTCAARVLVFDMRAGGRLITEVRGPRLHVHDVVFYRGRLYTVAVVAGSRFALDYRGKPFVNGGSAIYDGRATVLGVVSAVICRPALPKQSAQ
ncbi:MAG: hypothetical protein JO345_33610 [Streptosporangiaceae bacterium]|nr:hypothetical protein [Streptosporangiaceae bacterium]